MRPGLDHRAEEWRGLAEFGEMSAHDVKARMGARLVVRPGRAAKLGERLKGTVAPDDDIGEIDRPALIAFSPRHWYCKQFDIALRLVHFLDIGQATEPQNMDRSRVEQPLALLPWDAIDVEGRYADAIFDKARNGVAETLAILGHA